MYSSMSPSPPEAVSLGRTWVFKARQFTHSLSGNEGRRKMNGCREKRRVGGKTRLCVNVCGGKWEAGEATPTAWGAQGPSDGDKKERNANICNGQKEWKHVYLLAESRRGSLGALPAAWRSNHSAKQNVCTRSKDEAPRFLSLLRSFLLTPQSHPWFTAITATIEEATAAPWMSSDRIPEPPR